jgi:prepilin-type processing-associated H-X9-DG protein
MFAGSFGQQLVRQWRWASSAVIILALAALLAVSGPPRETANAEEADTALPPDLAKISPDSFLIASIRVSEIWNSDLYKQVREHVQKDFPEFFQDFEKQVGVGVHDIERISLVISDLAPRNSEPVFVVGTSKALDKDRVLKAALPERTEKNTDKHTIYVGKDHKAICFLGAKVFVAGSPQSVETFLDKPIAKKGPLSPVLHAAAGAHYVAAGMNPAPLAALADQLPPQAEPFKPLMAAQSSLLTVDLTDQLKVDLRGTFTNAADAEKAEKAFKQVLGMGRGLLKQGIQETEKQGKDWAPIVDLLKHAEKGLENARLTRKENVVEATTAVKVDPAFLNASLIDAVQRTREAAARIRSANNLRQIALAMHNYHDTTGTFPPAAIFDKDGKPLVSWRVLILPYVEQDNLYKQFHLDEPWDSAHNKKLLEQMPPVYKTTEADAKKHLTRYLGFAGKGAFFDGAKGIRIADITDGTSNTIMVVEAAQGVPWTKPDDVKFDDGKLVPRVGGVFKNGFNAAFCDGSVRFLKKTIKEDTLRALITRNGGEVIPQDGEN